MPSILRTPRGETLYQGVVYLAVVFFLLRSVIYFGRFKRSAHESAHNQRCDLRQRTRWSQFLTTRPAGQNAHIKAHIKVHMKAHIIAHIMAHRIAHIKANINSETRKCSQKKTTPW
jgi:hypothetical protein